MSRTPLKAIMKTPDRILYVLRPSSSRGKAPKICTICTTCKLLFPTRPRSRAGIKLLLARGSYFSKDFRQTPYNPDLVKYFLDD